MRRVALMLPLLALAAVPAHAAAAPPRLYGLEVTNGSTPYLGDGPLLTTVSPNGDGFRDAAHVRFRLSAPARVALAVVQTDAARSDPESVTAHVIARLRPRLLSKGANELVWAPARATPPRTYVLQLTVTGPGGRRVYGAERPGARLHGPVVRVQ